MSQHHHIGVGGVDVADRSAENRGHAEDPEGVRRRRHSPQTDHAVTGSHELLAHAGHGKGVCQRARRLPVEELRQGSTALHRRASWATRGHVLDDANESIRVRIWQRPQQDCVHDAHDRCRRANTERQAEERRHDESRGATELPPCVDDVAAQIVEQPDSARVAVFLPGLVERTELDPRLAHSFVVRQALSLVRRHLLVVMELQLIVQVTLDGAAPEQGTKSVHPVGEHGRLRYVLSMTCETAALSFRHAEISVSSRARPALVSS